MIGAAVPSLILVVFFSYLAWSHVPARPDNQRVVTAEVSAEKPIAVLALQKQLSANRPESFPTPDQNAVKDQLSPDQHAADDRTQVTSTPEQSPSVASTESSSNAAPSPAPETVDKAPPSSSTSLGTTATGIPLHMGPRGGVYHYSKSGNKVYQRKKR